MMKFLKHLVLISFIIIVLGSCTEQCKYTFNVINLDRKPVTYIAFTFSEDRQTHIKYKRYVMKADENNEISVTKGTILEEIEHDSNTEIRLFPKIDYLPNGGQVDLVIYGPIKVHRKSANEYEILRVEGVIGYFLNYSYNDQIYTTISRSNSITIPNNPDKNIINWDKKEIPIDNSFTIIDPFSQLYKREISQNKLPKGGYIFKSQYIDSLQMLN